jgi:hypothetical protein
MVRSVKYKYMAESAYTLKDMNMVLETYAEDRWHLHSEHVRHDDEGKELTVLIFYKRVENDVK